MRIVATGLLAAALFVCQVQAQICAPLPDSVYPFTVGQPSNVGIAPICTGAVAPATLAASGNPNLVITSVAPPGATPGSLTALLFLPVALGPPVPAPPFLYCGYVPAFPIGFPETPVGPPFGPNLTAFITPPAPGGPLAVPLPPGIPTGLLGFVVVTVGLEFTPLGLPCVWATNGIRLGT